jgi:hypothetical protein
MPLRFLSSLKKEFQLPLIESPFLTVPPPTVERPSSAARGKMPTIQPPGAAASPDFNNPQDDFNPGDESDTDRRRRLEEADIVKAPKGPAPKKQAIDELLAALDPKLNSNTQVNRDVFSKAQLNLGSWLLLDAGKNEKYKPDFSVGFHASYKVYRFLNQNPLEAEWTVFTGPSVVSFNGGVYTKGTDRYFKQVPVYADFASTLWGWHVEWERSAFLLPYLSSVSAVKLLLYPYKTHKVFTDANADTPQNSEAKTHNVFQWQGAGVEVSWQAELAKMMSAGMFAQVCSAAPGVLRMQFGLQIAAVLSDSPKQEGDKVP